MFSRPGLTLWSKLGLLVTNGFNGVLLLLGSSLVANTFLARYSLLFKDNDHTGVRTGAAYVDVEGLFSTLDIIYVSTFVELGIMGIVGYSLYRIKQRYEGLFLARTPDGSVPKATFALRVPLKLAIGLLALDLTFFLAVVIRNHVFVAPNEPTIQIPYIERHIAATTSGYRLDDIETAISQGQRNNLASFSDGFIQPRVCRGRSLSTCATRFRCRWLWTDKSLPRGKY